MENTPENNSNWRKCSNYRITKTKKELSQKQIDHLNNIRIKALEKKKIIKLQKMKDLELSIEKPDV